MPDAASLALSLVLERVLIYIAVSISMAVAFSNWRRANMRAFRQPLLAFLALWFIYGTLLAGAVDLTLLPFGLMRGLEFVAIVLLAWGFLSTALSARSEGALIGIGITFAAALSAFSISASGNAIAEPDWLANTWAGGTLIIAVTTVVVLIGKRSTYSSSAAIAAFAALAASSVLTLMLLTDMAGIVRMMAFFVFPIALYQTALANLSRRHDTLLESDDNPAKQTQHFSTLVEASTYLFSTFDRDELLNRVLKHAAAGFEFDQAIIALIEDKSSYDLRVINSYPSGIIEKDFVFSIHQQPALAQTISGGKQLTLDARGQGRSELSRLLKTDSLGPTIIQPLATQDDTIGLFIIFNPTSQRPFSSRRKRLLEALGAQIAAAIENGRLYNHLNTQAKELARLLTQRDEEVGWRAAILESISDGVVFTDRSDVVIMANANAARILDTPYELLLDQPLNTIFERMQPSDDNLARGPAKAEVDTVRATFTLGTRTIFTTMTPMHGVSGVRIGMLVIFRDITPQIEAQQAQVEFLDNIVREIRLPLQAIEGYADLLARNAAGQLPAAARSFVETIRANAERLDAQMKAVLQFNELKHGHIQLNVEESDVASILAETANDYQPHMEARNLSFELDVLPDLPTVHVDRARVRQVLDQLLDNALRFTADGGHVKLSAAPLWDGQSSTRPAHVAVKVADDGIGFDRMQGERLFEQFYRSEESSQVDQAGLGIGLSIARGLCESMGGHLWADGEKGRGATFTFILPVARIAASRVGDAATDDSSLESWIEETISFPDDEDNTEVQDDP